MILINKQDVLKTVLILWFVATTCYVAYDQYASYKVKGISQAYNSGYVAAIDELIKKTKESGCQPFEVTKDEEKVSIVDNSCLSAQAQPQPQAGQKAAK
jgi:hypothetical protein